MDTCVEVAVRLADIQCDITLGSNHPLIEAGDLVSVVYVTPGATSTFFGYAQDVNEPNLYCELAEACDVSDGYYVSLRSPWEGHPMSANTLYQWASHERIKSPDSLWEFHCGADTLQAIVLRSPNLNLDECTLQEIPDSLVLVILIKLLIRYSSIQEIYTLLNNYSLDYLDL